MTARQYFYALQGLVSGTIPNPFIDNSASLTTWGFSNNNTYTEADYPNLLTTTGNGSFTGNTLLKNINVPILNSTGGLNISNNNILEKILFQSLITKIGNSAFTFNANSLIQNIDFPLLTAFDAVGGVGASFQINNNPNLLSLNFNSLQSLTPSGSLNINGNQSLITVNFPLLNIFNSNISGWTIQGNNSLQNISITNLTSANVSGTGRIRFLNNPLLNNIIFNPSLNLPLSSINIVLTNNSLFQSNIDDILNKIDGWGRNGGTLNLTGGTNSTPSAAGLISKANLVARGWTVTNN